MGMVDIFWDNEILSIRKLGLGSNRVKGKRQMAGCREAKLPEQQCKGWS